MTERTDTAVIEQVRAATVVTSASGPSLRSRILLLFFVTSAIVAAVVLGVTLRATYNHSTQQLENQHRAAAKVMLNQLQMRSTLLRDGLGDLSSSFSLKQLIVAARDDEASLQSAMLNYQQRLGGDFFAVLDDQGLVISASDPNVAITEPSLLTREGPTWARIGDSIYLTKAAPVRFAERSRNINAWLVMGMRSEALVGDDLIDLTGMQMTLAKLGDEPEIWGSTIDTRGRGELSATLGSLRPGINEIDINGASTVAGVNGIEDSDGLVAIATLPSSEAYLNYRELLLSLLAVLAVATILALMAALRISQSITDPLNKLVAIAHRIREGEQATEFPKESTSEVTVLSGALEEMQGGIREREQQINSLAFFDSLTGLPNRNSFLRHIEQQLAALNYPETLSVALMDVDRFKDINDTIGHETGDRLLKMIGERIQASVDKADFIARLGGDEFAIVSARAGACKLEPIGQQIAAMFEQPFGIDGLLLDVDVSVGIAAAPLHERAASGLLQKADIALYDCKGTHDRFRVFSEDLDKHSIQRLSLMAELKEAIADGQLVLFYQPKLTLADDTFASVECLVRWQHPTHGRIPPDDFIPLAEQTGAIREVTHWALATAMEQQQRWAELGINVAMAVNISAVDLIDMRLPAYVGDLLTEFNADPANLTLEVTESAIMQDPKSAMLALNNLQRMGVRLSIDDFGTGFSSMAQLKKMPVNELKIDKAFVLALASNREDQVMVKTIVDLARNLGLSTVAEGVEDEASVNLLREMGCTKGQGFFMSRPLPQEELTPWLQRQGESASA